MLFAESLQELQQTRDMAVFLLECREDEERQADFPNKEASSPVLGNDGQFTDGAILTKI